MTVVCYKFEFKVAADNIQFFFFFLFFKENKAEILSELSVIFL